MTVQHINDPKTSIGDVIDRSDGGGVLVETKGRSTYAVMPLDDGLLDFLLERNPAFQQECQAIRKRMRDGDFHSHADVRRTFKD